MTEKARLLIIEDESAIGSGLVDVFIYHGYQVEWAQDGREGYQQARSGQFDLVLLDVMLPSMDGFAICGALSAECPELAIIMLTARSTDEDFITGFSLGADDYVAKPFSVAQLVWRVQAVLRRTLEQHQLPSTLELANGIRVDLTNLQAQDEEQVTPLSRREAQVLAYLLQHPERPVSREELLHKVWGYPPQLEIETRTVEIHIAKLRRKIERDPKHPNHLLTVRGAGYRLLPSGSPEM